MRYADHIEQSGMALFERVCRLGLEGTVAKYKFSSYGADGNCRGCISKQVDVTDVTATRNPGDSMLSVAKLNLWEAAALQGVW